jgi:hypothetical protein
MNDYPVSTSARRAGIGLSIVFLLFTSLSAELRSCAEKGLTLSKDLCYPMKAAVATECNASEIIS